MAYIKAHDTKQKRKGKPVKRYEVVWREPHPVTGKTRFRQESYPTRELAEVRRDELNAAKHTVSGTSALADAKVAGGKPFAHYAQAWLSAQRVRAASGGGKIRPDTVDGYEKRLAVYALPEFGTRPIASISPADCEAFLASLVARGIAPATLKHHWSVLRAVFVYAVRHKAIAANPVDAVDYSGNSAKRRNKRHHPLTGEQVAALAASIGERYPVYQLFTLFAAYTGLRAEELCGLEVGDLAFQPASTGPACAVHVRRAKKRKAAATGTPWVTAPLKSTRSNRVVPLPVWLAGKMADYLAEVHPHADNPTAPLWPNRALGGARRRGCRAVAPLDWTEPIDCGAYYRNLMKPALSAVGLPASAPATAATATAPAKDAVHGVRLHDLRHTFAVLQLSASKPFMLVSEWLGHSTYTLTLDVYGGWIPNGADAAANTLPEPTVAPKAAQANVVPLRHGRAG